MLYKVDDMGRELVVVPEVTRPEILNFCHDDPISGGHMGFLKTLYKLRERFFWPRMADDIKNYVESCKDCQSYKRRLTVPHKNRRAI